MAEKKGVGHAYNVDFLNVVFAASSIFLFLSVIWMVWDDYDREWKNTQRRFVELETAGDAGQPRAGGARRRSEQAERAAGGAGGGRRRTWRPIRQKVDELQAQMAEIDARLYRESQDYQFAKATYDQDRYDFEAARVADASKRGSQGRGGRGAGEADQRARTCRSRRRPPSATPCSSSSASSPARSAKFQKQIDELNAEQTRLRTRLDVIAPSVAEGLLPRRAAARLHGADDQGAAGHPAERRRRRELHAGGEDGPVPDLPPGDRPRRLREVPAAVHDASEPATSISAATRRIRWIRSAAPSATKGWGSRSASATRRTRRRPTEQKHEWEEKYHWEEPHLWDYPMLPTSMTEASCAKCHKQEVFVPERREAQRRLRDLRARRLLRLPQDPRLREPAQAGPDPDEDRLEADAGLGEDLDSQSARGEADHLDAARLVQLELELARGRRRATRSRSTRPSPICSRTPSSHELGGRRVRRAATRSAASRSSSRSAAWAATSSTRRRARRPARTAPSASRCRTSATRPPTSGSTTGSAIRSTTAPTTYMPDLRLTDAQVADVATYLSTLEAGRRRRGQGDAGSGGRRRGAARLLPRGDAVRGGQGRRSRSWTPNAKQLELGQRVINRYGCFSCHEIKGFENDAADRHRAVRGRQQAGLAARFRVRRRHPAHLEDRLVPDQAPRSAHLRQGPRAAGPTRSCGCRTSTSADEESRAAADGDHELPARDPAGAGDAGRDRRAATSWCRAATLVHRRNCVGCHVIEGSGGDYLKLVADPSLGPPLLTPEGARVQPDWLYAFLRGADHDPAVARRADADLRPRRSAPERRHQLLRRDLEHDRAVPDARRS